MTRAHWLAGKLAAEYGPHYAYGLATGRAKLSERRTRVTASLLWWAVAGVIAEAL